MKIINPGVIIKESEMDATKLGNIEQYARVCYKSDFSGMVDYEFLKKLVQNGHESVLEHEKVTVCFVVDRGISNQIIRHRIASYSQESTRYCNYSNNRFRSEIVVISPCFFSPNSEAYQLWKKSCEFCERQYLELCKISKPEEARSVLPNSLKTELVTTYNFREWRHFFNLRCSAKAHPQMRQITIPLLLFFQKNFPVIFDDLNFDREFCVDQYAEIVIEK